MGWKRSCIEKERLIKLFSNTGGYHKSGKVFYNYERKRFQRVYNSRSSSFYKKYVNKRTRRILKYDDTVRSKSNDYIKATGVVSDHWW
jgi:hypothetical protein